MQGPEPYLLGMGAHLKCAVDPTRDATIDSSHRAFLNHEVYFVSDDEALRTFVSAPYRYCGKVTDPVSLVRFQPTSASPVRSFGGRLFYFASSETLAKFDGDPRLYGTPKPTMHEKG